MFNRYLKVALKREKNSYLFIYLNLKNFFKEQPFLKEFL